MIPVDLGGSPTRCAVMAPPEPPPGPDLVEALVHHYVTERMPAEGARVEVAFFHGGIPGDDLLDAARPYPIRVAGSPADLSRAQALHLRERGVTTIELDVLTFDAGVLRDCRRGYTARHAEAMLAGLRELGFRLGVGLWPGLPGSSHRSALDDVAILARDHLVDFVRIYPALAFAGSELARMVREGRWRPMRLGEAVTTVHAMVEALERAGIEVARVGLQPGPDIRARVVAGPVHPNLRGLVEARRFRTRMARALAEFPPGSHAAVRVHPKDLSWAKGSANENVRALRANLRLCALHVEPDEQVKRGTVEVDRRRGAG